MIPENPKYMGKPLSKTQTETPPSTKDALFVRAVVAGGYFRISTLSRKTYAAAHLTQKQQQSGITSLKVSKTSWCVFTYIFSKKGALLLPTSFTGQLHSLVLCQIS